MIEPTQKDIGRMVIYKKDWMKPGDQEQGIITSFNDSYVFVLSVEIADMEKQFKGWTLDFKNLKKSFAEKKESSTFNKVLRREYMEKYRKLLATGNELKNVERSIKERAEFLDYYEKNKAEWELSIDNVLELNECVRWLRSDINKHVENCKKLMMANEDTEMPSLDDQFAKWNDNKEKLERLMKE